MQITHIHFVRFNYKHNEKSIGCVCATKDSSWYILITRTTIESVSVLCCALCSHHVVIRNIMCDCVRFLVQESRTKTFNVAKTQIRHSSAYSFIFNGASLYLYFAVSWIVFLTTNFVFDTSTADIWYFIHTHIRCRFSSMCTVLTTNNSISLRSFKDAPLCGVGLYYIFEFNRKILRILNALNFDYKFNGLRNVL